MPGSGSLASSSAALMFALACVQCGASKPGAPLARGSAAGGAPALPRRTTPSFLVGYNEAWFGARFGSDLTSRYDAKLVEHTLDAIGNAGGRVVRVWLFEGREGVVLGASSPRIEGVDPELLAHVGEMLDFARARGLWIYLTLLDANGMPQDAGPVRDFYWNLLNDERGEGAAFREKVVAPLLGVLDAHEDVVYGVDIVNEIAAARARSYWRDPLLGPRAYIRRTAAFMKARSPWLRVTSTAGWDMGAADLSTGFFSGLGLDFYDLHVYADDGAIAGSAQVCARAREDKVPIILGEFGQRSHVIDDALQTRTTRGFLEAAKAACFEGALAWRYDAEEPWWAYARRDGSLRPAAAVMQQLSAQP